MGTKLKNISKVVFILAVIVFCVILGLAIDISETISLSELLSGKQYYQTEIHKQEIANDLNNLIKLMENNPDKTKHGSYKGTFDDSGIKFYNKNVPDELKDANYTYFFAHYSSFHVNASFLSDDYDQYSSFADLYEKLNDNGSKMLLDNSNYYDIKPAYLLYQYSITENRNTYIVRNKEIFSKGNYVNDRISFNDLSEYNKGLTDILIIISYPDRYILSANERFYTLYIFADILAAVLIFSFFYIVLYIAGKYSNHIDNGSGEYLKISPKYWDLTIVLILTAVLVSLLLKPSFFLIPVFILVIYLCCKLPSLFCAIKNKVLLESSFAVKTVRFTKRNKEKIYSIFKVLKKPLIWIYNVLAGKKFNINGASAVEKFIFRYTTLLLMLIAVAPCVIYKLYDKILLTDTAIFIIIIYILLFIFYHYHAQKLLNSFNLIEKQIEKMYSGCYQIDTNTCKDTAFERDINMLAQIGNIFEKNMEDKIKMERTKVELVTNVSHDLKTPLTSIISYIDLLSRDNSLSQEAKDYVNILSKKSDRLKHIVNDVFELAMTTSGEIKVENAVLNLNKLIIQTTADLEDKFKAAGMDVRTKTADMDIFISSDGDRIYRIMQNLIDNALKFSLKGTRIYIQETVSDGKATVKVTNTANYEMDFTKEDVMERFFRGDKSRNSEGNGLGLSIAQGFTIACGGTFDIDINGDQFNAIMVFPVVPETVVRKAEDNA